MTDFQITNFTMKTNPTITVAASFDVRIGEVVIHDMCVCRDSKDRQRLRVCVPLLRHYGIRSATILDPDVFHRIATAAVKAFGAFSGEDVWRAPVGQKTRPTTVAKEAA